MKQLAIRLSVLMLWVAVGCTGIRGDGKEANDTRPVGAFSEVEVSNVIHLHLTLGKADGVTLTGDANLLPLVTTEVQGDRLRIGTKERIRPKRDLIAAVTAKDVTTIRASGASTLRVEGIHNDALQLEISGAGDAKLRGETGTLTLNLSGAADVDATALKAAIVDLRVSGAGTVELGEPTKLTVDISGAAKVRYRGSPQIAKQISGAGTLTKR